MNYQKLEKTSMCYRCKNKEICKIVYQTDDCGIQQANWNCSHFEELEKPVITECRNEAIEKNLPLYFVYYEETGIFEVYITETKELFEKRHCAKHLPNYEFKEIVNGYLDNYSDWKGNKE